MVSILVDGNTQRERFSTANGSLHHSQNLVTLVSRINDERRIWRPFIDPISRAHTEDNCLFQDCAVTVDDFWIIVKCFLSAEGCFSADQGIL